MFASGDSDLETSQEVSEEVLKASITKDDRRMSRRMSSISGVDLGQLLKEVRAELTEAVRPLAHVMADLQHLPY